MGAVATGSMKAQDAATAAGPSSDAGATPTVIANAPRIGARVVIVATLDVSSVRNRTSATTTMMKNSGGRALSASRLSPIHFDKPVRDTASPSAIPPPNRTRTPHGRRTASSQFRIARPSPAPAGTRNMSKAPNMAIIMSAWPL